MLNADQLQLFTLALAAGTFLVSLLMLTVLLRRTRLPREDNATVAGKSLGIQSAAASAGEDQQIVAVITAAITAAQADESQASPLAAAIAAAVIANRAASGSTAGFVIRKIRRV